MIFLIEYNRPQGTLIQLRHFDVLHRQEAQDARLNLELALSRAGVNHEVVLLEAANEEALRNTHRRYFESLKEISDFFMKRIQ